ncbi:hypothetical protein [Streptomyces sp. NPDC088258]|uniref:hypothetical protein n=1 Tax=Streptomyces sp. NPDC088258 TaxID=3365849 RepID=UPI00381A23E0
MSALTVAHEPEQGWDDLVHTWKGTGAPDLEGDGRTRGPQGGDHRGDHHRVTVAVLGPRFHRFHGVSDSPTATLHGEPRAGTYRMLETVEYGGKLTLPAPFDLAVDTGEFTVS